MYAQVTYGDKSSGLFYPLKWAWTVLPWSWSEMGKYKFQSIILFRVKGIKVRKLQEHQEEIAQNSFGKSLNN